MLVNIAQTGFRATSRFTFKVENGKFDKIGTLLNRKWFESAKRIIFQKDSSSFHSFSNPVKATLYPVIDHAEEMTALGNGVTKRLGRFRALDNVRKRNYLDIGGILTQRDKHDVQISPAMLLKFSVHHDPYEKFYDSKDSGSSTPKRRSGQHGHERFFKLLSRFLSARDHDQAKNVEDVLFDMFKSEETGLLPIGKFLAALRSTGLRKNDPRLAEMTENLKKAHKLSGSETGSPETIKLDRETFKNVISANIVLISRAFRHQFIIPDFQGFTKHIEDFYWKCKSNTEGKVASYIPQLARMNPDSWGVSVCTIDGQRFSIGDVNIPFTLQSCSKPLTYAIALDQLGADCVHQYVGQEPSGRMFNELILDYNKKPHNPMINAGAIIVCSLLKTLVKPEMTLAEKFDFTMSYFKKLAGGEYLGFNNAVFLSEREAADRNYALGFYMREHKCYPEKANLRECMDFYFQCCSMEGTCDCMAVMAATLANGGICPITDEKVLKPDSVRDVLSLMHSCGMYDYSGQFAFKVGLPAKSGVCGGMLVVIPNVMGICTWSPPLDSLGNSCRGVQFCEELVREFNFHRYDNLKHAANKKDPRRHRFETKGLSIVNLLFSAASGDVTAMRRHRLSGMDMTLSDYDGRTALHLCAAEGHLECVQFLLEHCNVPYNPKDRWGNTPLDEAHTFGQTKVIEYLEEWEKKTRVADLTKNDDDDSLPPPLSSASGSPPASTTGNSDISIGDSGSPKQFP